MFITDLADEKLGTTGGRDLSTAGPNCQRIAEAIGYDASTTSLIATVFWQAFINSPAFNKTLQRTKITPRGLREGEQLILRHGVERAPRHDLIILDPGFPDREEPSVITVVNALSNELREGWKEFIQNNRPITRAERIIFSIGQEAAVEAIKAQEFGLIVTAPSTKTFTSLLPSTALGVAHRIEPSVCTIGILTRDVKGREGATTALHNLDPQNNTVYVGGMQGVIDSKDKSSVTDSCFIEVPGLFAQYAQQAQKLSGPLQGKTPAINQIVTFQREGQGWINATVIGWNPNIPIGVTPKKRLLIYTNAITIPSDSGTALIDSSNHVVGFAYQLNVDLGYSSWIWAETVYKAHMLQ